MGGGGGAGVHTLFGAQTEWRTNVHTLFSCTLCAAHQTPCTACLVLFVAGSNDFSQPADSDAAEARENFPGEGETETVGIANLIRGLNLGRLPPRSPSR